MPHGCREPEAGAVATYSGLKHCLSVKLVTGCELVLSLALANAAAKLLAGLAKLQHLAQHTGHLDLLLLAAAESKAPVGSAFVLSNQTGLPATAWLTHTGSTATMLQSKGVW